MLRITRILGALLALGILGSLASIAGAFLARDRMVSRGDPDDDEVDLVAILDSTRFTSTARALRRLRATTWYGGGTIDLRAATLDPAGASVTLRALFGGIQVVIPASWRVELRGIGIMGGMGDGRSADLVDPQGPMLTVDGFAIFGGAGIVAGSPDLDAPSAEVGTETASATVIGSGPEPGGLPA